MISHETFVAFLELGRLGRGSHHGLTMVGHHGLMLPVSLWLVVLLCSTQRCYAMFICFRFLMVFSCVSHSDKERSSRQVLRGFLQSRQLRSKRFALACSECLKRFAEGDIEPRDCRAIWLLFFQDRKKPAASFQRILLSYTIAPNSTMFAFFAAFLCYIISDSAPLARSHFMAPSKNWVSKNVSPHLAPIFMLRHPAQSGCDPCGSVARNLWLWMVEF